MSVVQARSSYLPVSTDMPYIDAKDRNALEPHTGRDPMTAGELNYAITCLVDGYLAGMLDYQGINDCLGALEGAKLELYRRVAAPYEDHKKALNGDVYVTQVPSHGVKKVVA